MIKWKLESFMNDVAIYSYQPEGKGAWGKMKFDRNLGKAEIIERASASTDRYDYKAISKFEDEFCEGDLPYEFIQAWG